MVSLRVSVVFVPAIEFGVANPAVASLMAAMTTSSAPETRPGVDKSVAAQPAAAVWKSSAARALREIFESALRPIVPLQLSPNAASAVAMSIFVLSRRQFSACSSSPLESIVEKESQLRRTEGKDNYRDARPPSFLNS